MQMYKNILNKVSSFKKSDKNTKTELMYGFTLIETLVAITILLVAIGGPLTLATKSLFSAIVAKDQFIATYLVQDAIEYIRYKRDSNYLATEPVPWLYGLDSCISNVCRIDSRTDTIEVCGSDGCPYLKYDESNGFYGYLNGNETFFNRTITLTEVNTHEYAIDVNVSWRTGTFEADFTSKENIFNWLDNGL